MTKGEIIGTIVRLQVQRYPIKVKGEGYLAEGILPVSEPLADLHDGRRGFIVTVDDESEAVEIRPGDRVFASVRTS